MKLLKVIPLGHIPALQLLFHCFQGIDNFVASPLILVLSDDNVQHLLGKLHPVDLLIGIGLDEPSHDLVVAEVELSAWKLLFVPASLVFFLVLRSESIGLLVIGVIAHHPLQVWGEVFQQRSDFRKF